MTPERARELAQKAWHDMEDCKEWNAPLIKAILQACAEDQIELSHLKRELDELRKGEFICAKCCLRKDSEHVTDHDF